MSDFETNMAFPVEMIQEFTEDDLEALGKSPVPLKGEEQERERMDESFKTNADFIRSLSIDELAVVINHPCNCCVYEHPFCIDQEVHCCNGIRQWLNKPYNGHPLSDVCERILKEAREGRIFGEVSEISGPEVISSYRGCKDFDHDDYNCLGCVNPETKTCFK